MIFVDWTWGMSAGVRTRMSIWELFKNTTRSLKFAAKVQSYQKAININIKIFANVSKSTAEVLKNERTSDPRTTARLQPYLIRR